MSVDYEANYGIGYKVCETEEIKEIEEMEDGLNEYLECEAGEGFYCFETGNAYSGESDGVFLGIRDPFKDGLDLTSAKERLDKEVKRLKLDIDGDFGTIGGLYIY
jgi:hypothetical protein